MRASESEVPPVSNETVGRGRREMRRAQRFADEGRVDEAIESLQAALRCGADAYTCYLRLARLYQTQQQLDEAVKAAESAIAEHPDKLSAREAAIALYLEARDYRRVVEASKALLKLSPNHVPAHDALGAAYIGLGDAPQALRVANQLVQLDPYEPAHRFKKALLCQHVGDMQTAVEEFERVIGMAPEGPLADGAREQLDTLDLYQLNGILTIAAEDPVFRLKLERDPDSAVGERGFYLSDPGRERLIEIVFESLVHMEPAWTTNLYH